MMAVLSAMIRMNRNNHVDRGGAMKNKNDYLICVLLTFFLVGGIFVGRRSTKEADRRCFHSGGKVYKSNPVVIDRKVECTKVVEPDEPNLKSLLQQREDKLIAEIEDIKEATRLLEYYKNGSVEVE